MKRGLIVVVVLAVGFGLFRMMSSPGGDTAGSPGGQTIIGTGLAAGAAVRTDAWKRYFQRVLIESGDDASQPVGKDLTELGLNARQLQAMSIDDAYTLAHDAATKVEETATRQRYLLELFNESER